MRRGGRTREERKAEKKKGDEEEEEAELAEAYNKRSEFIIGKMRNRGAWTAEEDRKLAEAIEINGPKRWKAIAHKAGINRCGKSCRLRWMNYLRPNLKRGNISDQEEDLILRLHKLLGNRWSLIAGRLPGRTDNEIKNYWNSYLSKKIHQADHGKEHKVGSSNIQITKLEVTDHKKEEEQANKLETSSFDADDFFNFSNENPSNLEWLSRFIQL